MGVGEMFGSEFLGTVMMIAIGVMVCGSRSLPKTGAYRNDWINVSLGWGLAVFVGVYVAWPTGAHLNPAVTLARVIQHWSDSSVTLNGISVHDGGIAVTMGNVAIYLTAQFLGAFVGACVGFMAMRRHFAEPANPDVTLTVFCTKPAVASPLWNVVTESIGTAILVIWITVNGGTPTQVGPLAIAMVVTVLTMALGGISGAALNPARDFCPRLAYQLLPIAGKGDADWGYAWVPFVGPLIGSALGVCIPLAFGLMP
ncbi:aquaporin family protein [Bifidobacterium sp. LC6]|uniref:Aquaporin family protein n=1 Tax=Bifidobacterium colobi TaxID=2809026 RepID=A0ABS5UW80_9BIFI|nr:MIP/aquaporin family protein [Bifidobacterium colobi]MBT1175365.1 aquaporin family protein [Bifidobacterium colobi]